MPETFNGDKNDFDRFIRQIYNWFLFQSEYFQEDKIKILWTLNLIKGPKVDNWVDRLDLAIKKDQINFEDFCETWDEFYTLLENKFQDKNKQLNAQMQIQSIKQKDNMTVDEYISDFKILAEETGFDDRALLMYFLRGIKSSIAYRSRQYQPTNTYLGWQRLAKRIEKDQLQFDQIMGAARPSDKQTQCAPPPPTPASSSKFPRNQQGQFLPLRRPQPSQRPNPWPHNPPPVQYQQRPPPPPAPRPAPRPDPPTHPTFAPMDLSRVRQKEDRTCYRCKQKGHLIKDCPVKQISELAQDSINEILNAHFASPPPSAPAPVQSTSRPPVTVEEIPDEEFPESHYYEGEEEEQPLLYEVDDNNYYEEDQGF